MSISSRVAPRKLKTKHLIFGGVGQIRAHMGLPCMGVRVLVPLLQDSLLGKLRNNMTVLLSCAPQRGCHMIL